MNFDCNLGHCCLRILADRRTQERHWTEQDLYGRGSFTEVRCALLEDSELGKELQKEKFSLVHGQEIAALLGRLHALLERVPPDLTAPEIMAMPVMREVMSTARRLLALLFPGGGGLGMFMNRNTIAGCLESLAGRREQELLWSGRVPGMIGLFVEDQCMLFGDSGLGIYYDTPAFALWYGTETARLTSLLDSLMMRVPQDGVSDAEIIPLPIMDEVRAIARQLLESPLCAGHRRTLRGGILCSHLRVLADRREQENWWLERKDGGICTFADAREAVFEATEKKGSGSRGDLQRYYGAETMELLNTLRSLLDQVPQDGVCDAEIILLPIMDEVRTVAARLRRTGLYAECGIP
ncbi:MAG: hypothetical protein JWM59_756 [Verrucomicrobiales bacterium]|nr:hypothetical protein [Verrucomicrobiales bacterium]